MSIWQSGLESGLLDEIIAGRKTIEGRLNKGKFAEYTIGDVIELRRDHRGEDGVLRDGEPNQARAEIIGIRRYGSFREMVRAEGYRRVVPDAVSADTAAALYDTYYTAADQARYGVLAIEIRLLPS